ncbi:hypothetical protein SDC9_182826 [bioreactor metagenome]|uniref:Uncharacterized protein n=1 Tax=bioreactor metagenome TaxID=1076179 RepID=A0A645HB26_9ZZZZ
MPVAVVDRLEMVDVGEKKADRSRAAPVAGDQLVDQDAEGVPVEEPGQLVDRRHLLDPRLVMAERDVAEPGDDQRHQQADRQVDVQGLANAGECDILVLLDEQVPLQFGQVIDVEDVVVALIDELVHAAALLEDGVELRRQPGALAQVG